MEGGCWEEGWWTGWAGDVVGNEGLGVGVVDGGWRWVGGGRGWVADSSSNAKPNPHLATFEEGR
jgi:hypothetical protein